MDDETEAVLKKLSQLKAQQQQDVEHLFVMATRFIIKQANEMKRLRKEIRQLKKRLDSAAATSVTSQICAALRDSDDDPESGPALPLPEPPTHLGKK